MGEVCGCAVAGLEEYVLLNQKAPSIATREFL